jgi:hypothetical protein
MLGLMIAKASGASGCVIGTGGAVGVVGFGGRDGAQDWDFGAHSFAAEQ